MFHSVREILSAIDFPFMKNGSMKEVGGATGIIPPDFFSFLFHVGSRFLMRALLEKLPLVTFSRSVRRIKSQSVLAFSERAG